MERDGRPDSAHPRRPSLRRQILASRESTSLKERISTRQNTAIAMPPQDAQDEEEDYMSMTIVEPPAKETFAQRKLRQQREVCPSLSVFRPLRLRLRLRPDALLLHPRASKLTSLTYILQVQAEARAKVPSKAERAAQEAARREAALSSSTLDPSNKGFKMMAKLGFKPGDALGKQPSGADGAGSLTAATDNWGRPRTEPLNIVVKEGRGGIGLDSEKKRKLREEAEQAAKKAKAEEGDYRERLRLEREERRTEAQVRAAQIVAERLDAEAKTEAEAPRRETDAVEKDPAAEPGTSKPKLKIKPTSQINVLYRGLVREREESERSIQTRHALQTSLPSSFFTNPRLPGYEDATLDRDDEHALGLNRDPSTVVEQELEEEDPELDEFNALEPKERLRRLVMYLREKHRYCFWCKHRYETDEMEGCPGVTEEDHD